MHKIYEALPGAKRLGQKIATSALHVNALTIARVLSAEFPELTYHVVAEDSRYVDTYRAGVLVTDTVTTAQKIPEPVTLPQQLAAEHTRYVREEC